MSNGKDSNDAGSGGRDRYLDGLHQDMREMRGDVRKVTSTMDRLAGEWGMAKWVVGIAIAIAALALSNQDSCMTTAPVEPTPTVGDTTNHR